MRFGFADACLQHDTGPRHPESADRLEAIRRALDRTHGATFESPAPASRDALLGVHEPDHVQQIEDLCAGGGGALDSDTIVSEETWDAALASAGLGIWAATDTDPKRPHSAVPFALTRPPGHHALDNRSMGFCIFNNVAIAAEAALAETDADCVAVLDWDVHHGNGTQAIFLDRNDVPFVSLHEDGLYPGTGAMDECGVDDGDGANLNIPLQSGAGPPTYLQAMNTIVVPWLTRHDPDLLLVSAGFDAHEHDPISRMGFTTEGYGLLTKQVLTLAESIDAGVGFLLEGGYGLGTLAESVVMVNDVCNGYDPVSPTGSPREQDEELIESVRSRHGLGS